mmetsp:Transcript_4811/g.8459  ORF Transcript_4811/g.8459 Transcript_4811/m.8459 type:complete len:156 (-) Transcript_4811:43-510(-)
MSSSPEKRQQLRSSKQAFAPTDRKTREDAARTELMRRLEESGEKDRIKQALRVKLSECGWQDEMKDISKETIRSRGGVSKITVDELVSELLPRARASVPENVKSDLLGNVRDFARRDGIMVHPTGPPTGAATAAAAAANRSSDTRNLAFGEIREV